MTVSTIAFAITGVFWGDVPTYPPKDEGALKKWLNRLADALKKLAGKTFQALPAIIGSVAGAV